MKHGEGRSYDELKALGVRVVDTARMQNDFTIGQHSIFGVALTIDRDDIDRYVNALLAFWSLEGSFWCRLSN